MDYHVAVAQDDAFREGVNDTFVKLIIQDISCRVRSDPQRWPCQPTEVSGDVFSGVPTLSFCIPNEFVGGFTLSDLARWARNNIGPTATAQGCRKAKWTLAGFRPWTERTGDQHFECRIVGQRFWFCPDDVVSELNV